MVFSFLCFLSFFLSFRSSSSSFLGSEVEGLGSAAAGASKAFLSSVTLVFRLRLPSVKRGFSYSEKLQLYVYLFILNYSLHTIMAIHSYLHTTMYVIVLPYSNQCDITMTPFVDKSANWRGVGTVRLRSNYNNNSSLFSPSN